jgi:hypothetical protein
VLFCLLVTSCAGTGSLHRTDTSWDQTSLCSSSIGMVTAELAGATAIDCGTTLQGLGFEGNLEAITCARRASKSRSALRFGQTIFGPDAGDCNIVVRSADGELLHLRYYYDFSYTPQRKWLEVERCQRLVVEPPEDDPDKYFRLEGCVEDATEADRIIGMHLLPRG